MRCTLKPALTETLTVQALPSGNPPPGGGNPPPGGGNHRPAAVAVALGRRRWRLRPGDNPTQPGGLTFKVARKQTGVVLRGSVTTSGAAKIVVTALVSNRYLSTSRPKRVKKVTVGSKTVRRTSAGKASLRSG